MTRVAWVLGLAVVASAAAVAANPPCMSATQACTEWVAVGPGPQRILIYRTFPLDAPNDAIRRAVVMVHGAGRDADNYFRHVLAAAFLAGALEDTILIAPRFASDDGRSCQDKLADNELNWPCEGPYTWRSGAAAQGGELTSYDAMDGILRRLANRNAFPQLRRIVLAGHSAGGQFVTRYQMTNQVHDALGVPVTYVVSNPSSYAYLDELRPTAAAIPAGVAAAPPGYQPPAPAKPLLPFAEYPDARNCATYNQWPYGLQDRNGYSARLEPPQLRKQLVTRPATYLLGELDILPLYGFDDSCPAMAQGPTRLARGVAYERYLREKHGARHDRVIVPACGHSARCMFTSEVALPVLFPKE